MEYPFYSKLHLKGVLMTNLFKGLERIEAAREGLAGQSFMAGHS